MIPTSPIPGQKTGTSGLRRKVALVASTELYIENWLQSLMNALGGCVVGAILVLGGDGRFLNDVAAVSAVEIFAANGVKRLIVGKNCLLSTPACSAVIRSVNAFGGVIMTASHNPAGLHGDWGIKYNSNNGEPASEKITDLIYQETLKIDKIQKLDLGISPIDFTTIGERQIGNFTLQVIDPVDTYLQLLKAIFDFEKLARYFNTHKILFDGMHAVTGVYAHRIFCSELGLPESCLQNCVPLPDFAGGHPDPNLVYAHDLVDRMKNCGEFVLGAASDGDGDRNMIMGNRGWFVTPSDSLAIIADNAVGSISYFAHRGLVGVARSMPTSRAIDLVCAAKGIPLFQTPTGWKYFGNLMDAKLVNLCGEESFGTGADHIREKDGIWAVLAWMSILANNPGMSVQGINEAHWNKYGRHVYCRCDYEEVDANAANRMMKHIEEHAISLVGTEIAPGFVITEANQYEYTDPVDGSVASKQGMIVCFANGSRIVYRLSGTGSAGATIRIYMEHFVKEWTKDTSKLENGPLMNIAKEISQIEAFTQRTKPNVVT